MLNKKDRIFNNLYGLKGNGLKTAFKLGDWSESKEIIAKGKDWILKQVKDSGLRGRGGAGFPSGLKFSLSPKK